MRHGQFWILPLLICLLAEPHHAVRLANKGSNGIQTSVFLSPPFFLRPGSVVNEHMFNIPFPRGHIALKSLDAEVVDETGVSVPLHETYLHHWSVSRYYGKKDQLVDNGSNVIWVNNSGTCPTKLHQYFGIGSESRRTSTWIPDPYGVEIGDPRMVPGGYEERWMLNIHAIDTRGVQDRMGCTECRCSLYNATKDHYGNPLSKDYVGGFDCCYDQSTRCKLRDGYDGREIIRKLYMRFKVRWVQWNEASVVPVKIYIIDVSSCKVEYNVDQCDTNRVQNRKCVHTKKASLVVPHGGDIVYAAAHQHSGGLGVALSGQNGNLLCTSVPTYGHGEEAGNEAGYIVGMSTCYPVLGSAKIADGELLTIESNYNSKQMHIGVMGIFYVLVAGPHA